MDAREITTVRRPHLRRAEFGDRLAVWLEQAPACRRGGAGTAVVIVPEYLRAAASDVLADLRRTDWSGTVVAIVGYGGRTRGRHAIEDAREVLDDAGARVLETSLGLDTARVRTEGFDAADVLLRDLLLDDLAAPGPVSTNPCQNTD
ncbi:hypothetical protein LQ327_08040 [Actinomycetospora endophytica]|uniref:Uncharacterized protein n=1 Tax=Actinomycetospora endophytica TaxID=2291215 RepID=A0ABS8P507_9PSEU|nr:hypothetical protein [Actinomycetospora endophytica]MCD2193336.1 hypothetical protein [Actinomycetospora endophytica]